MYEVGQTFDDDALQYDPGGCLLAPVNFVGLYRPDRPADDRCLPKASIKVMKRKIITMYYCSPRSYISVSHETPLTLL